MAQYKAIDPNVEVNVETILGFLNVVKGFRELVLGILKNNGITNLKPGEWCNQQKWLNALKDISGKIGESTLFSTGLAIPEYITLPQDTNLKAALSSIDELYHKNHRGGKIGHFKLLEFNEEKKNAVMECENPNPTQFDKGVLTGFARKYKPEDASVIKVELDETKPTRVKGEDSDTFRITW